MKKQKYNEGFTMIELLMVIAIIGLLAAIGIYTLGTVKARARDAVRVADVDQLRKALDLYANDNDSGYPLSASAICINGTDIVTTALKNAGIISSPIADPVYTNDATNCYKYTSADGANFSIQYYLETDTIDSSGLHTFSTL